MIKTANPWLLYLAAVNALLAAIITSSIVPDDRLFSISDSGLFIALALPGHFFFLALLLSLPVYFAWRFLRSELPSLILAAMLFAVAILVVLVNARVFELYRFHLNGMVLNLVSGGEALQILSIPLSTWLIMICVAIGLLVAEFWLAKKLSGHFAGHAHRPRLLWLIAIGIMLAGQSYYAYSDARGNRQVTGMLRYIPWALPVTGKRVLRDLGVEFAMADSARLDVPAGSALDYPKNPLECSTRDGRPYHIVMLVVDSLRADMLTSEIMPNAYRLGVESRVFNDHFSGGNATRFGIFSLLYGLPGAYWFPMLREMKGSALIDALGQQDYQFFVHASASWKSPEFDRTVFAAVRAQIVSGKDLIEQYPDDHRHRDSIVTDDFLQRIERRDRDKPVFGLLFLDAPHSYTRDENAAAPFQPELTSASYLELDEDYDPTRFFNLYKNSVHYDDALIGQVVAALEREQMLDDTILVVTSDHGQEFNDSRENYWGHNSNFSRYQTQVPLIVKWPGDPAAVVDYRTSSEDIVPTLMQRGLQCENPVSDYSSGQNLYAPGYRSRPLLIESWSRRALLSAGLTYVFESYGDLQVYDLAYHEVVDQSMDMDSLLLAMHYLREYLK